MTPRVAADPCSTPVGKLGSTAVATSCPASLKKLAAPTLATSGETHGGYRCTARSGWGAESPMLVHPSAAERVPWSFPERIQASLDPGDLQLRPQVIDLAEQFVDEPLERLQVALQVTWLARLSRGLRGHEPSASWIRREAGLWSR
jgi:hypothetical protein